MRSGCEPLNCGCLGHIYRTSRIVRPFINSCQWPKSSGSGAPANLRVRQRSDETDATPGMVIIYSQISSSSLHVNPVADFLEHTATNRDHAAKTQFTARSRFFERDSITSMSRSKRAGALEIDRVLGCCQGLR